MLPFTTKRMVRNSASKSGNPDDDPVIEREAVDLVLVGLGLPQIELVELVRAQLQHVGHDAAGIERDAEYVGGGAVLAVRALAARGNAGDARAAEVGPENTGSDHAVMRHDDEALDLLVAGFAKANTAQLLLPSRARTSMRRMMPSGPGAAETRMRSLSV